MLDDDLAALAVLGQTKLAYIEGRPEQIARLTALTDIRTRVQAALDTTTAVATALVIASPSDVLTAAGAAQRMAQYTATLATLA